MNYWLFQINTQHISLIRARVFIQICKFTLKNIKRVQVMHKILH